MELTLVTCNIRFDNPADGPNAWPHRRFLLAKILLSHAPDVIATQEGRLEQLKDLESILVDYDLVDSHRSWIGERMYPSFFIKKNQFEIITSGDIWLSETPEIAGSKSFNSAFPRLFTYLKFQPVNSAQNLFLVNTHFDHVKSQTRVEQAKVLASEVRRFWSNDCPVVVMGDFNDSPESEVRRTVVSGFPGLQDSWKLYNSQEETSHHSFQGEMQNGARIDWLLVDEKLKVLSSKMDKSQENGLYPTDHFPVITRIKL
jgi:endonuclease/exonuclease/phosphatase family metal-dependent hydrolase